MLVAALLCPCVLGTMRRTWASLSSVDGFRDALREGGGIGAVVSGAGHDVGLHLVTCDAVARLYAVGGNVELGVAGNDTAALALGQLRTCAFFNNLHVDARFLEAHKLVGIDTCGAVISVELTLGDHLDIAGHVEQVFARVLVLDRSAGLQEGFNLAVLTFALVGIGFIVITGGQQHGYRSKQCKQA